MHIVLDSTKHKDDDGEDNKDCNAVALLSVVVMMEDADEDGDDCGGGWVKGVSDEGDDHC